MTELITALDLILGALLLLGIFTCLMGKVIEAGKSDDNWLLFQAIAWIVAVVCIPQTWVLLLTLDGIEILRKEARKREETERLLEELRKESN